MYREREFVRAAFVACGLMVAAPASAASSFSLDPPFAAGKYYEQNGNANCTDIGACQIVFSKIPAGRALNLERVTCAIEVQSHPLRSANLSIFRSSGESFLRPHQLAPSLTAEDSFNGIPVYFFAINQSTRYPFANGSPKVSVFQTIGNGDSQFAMSCQISGTLLP